MIYLEADLFLARSQLTFEGAIAIPLETPYLRQLFKPLGHRVKYKNVYGNTKFSLI
ncbi:hypothetical protein [Calothrix sp. NIES-2100]|uniref:hypothetical protein n=1 Tax=Calothrix sp. NIES-2100 TaxID=1954172 RepID=UPI0030D9E15F